MSEPRDLPQRKADVLEKLAGDKDIWVATASKSGEPCLVPLSFGWVHDEILLVTVRTHRTARNIAATGVARLALGPTRDVVSLEGTAEMLEPGELTDEEAERYAAQSGWDPRADESMIWIRFQPRRIQAWREVNELPARTIMEEGRWLD